jgi:hypothetical protein
VPSLLHTAALFGSSAGGTLSKTTKAPQLPYPLPLLLLYSIVFSTSSNDFSRTNHKFPFYQKHKQKNKLEKSILKLEIKEENRNKSETIRDFFPEETFRSSMRD